MACEANPEIRLPEWLLNPKKTFEAFARMVRKNDGLKGLFAPQLIQNLTEKPPISWKSTDHLLGTLNRRRV